MRTRTKVIIAAVAAFVVLDVIAIATGHGDWMGPIIVLLIGVPLYLLPTLIASDGKTTNAGAVAIINVFLGWTFLGWIVALAMAAGGTSRPAPVMMPPMKKCPDCAEWVLAEARVCRYCHRQF